MELQHINNYVENINEIAEKEKLYEIIEPDDFEHNFLDKYIGGIFLLAKIYVNETHKKDEFIDFNDHHEAIIMLSLLQLFSMFYDEDTNTVRRYEDLFKELNMLLLRFYHTMPDKLFNTLYILGYSKDVIEKVLNYLDKQLPKVEEPQPDFELIDEGFDFED